MTIWKFPLKIVNDQTVRVPVGAKMLTVQVQHGVPCLWALVVPENEKEERTIHVAATGGPVPEILGPYLGTCQFAQGTLVFHFFEGIL